jgi:CHAT domain-containing protein
MLIEHPREADADSVLTTDTSVETPKSMIIFPDNELWNVPFTIFAVEDDSSDKRFTVSLSPSIAVLKIRRLVSERHPAKHRLPFSMLLIGNPDCARTLGKLTEAERECNEVQSQLEKSVAAATCTILTGRQATKKAFLGRVRAHKLLHIAAHASDEPLAGKLPGYIYLASDDSGTDAHLGADEISELQLDNLELAFLNCCVTGVGRPNTNGFFGLGRALLLAGARAVVLSSVPIRDVDDTVEFARKFYEYYAGVGDERGRADLALNSAQLYAKNDKGIGKSIWGSYYVLRAE